MTLFIRESRSAVKNNIDFVLGVGGGSVIDTAKAIGYGVEYDGDFMDLYLGKAAPVSCLKIGAILTIPGAGSESSNGSVITSVSEGLKRSCDTDLARPVFAIMDPELTKTVPMYHTLAGAFDAIAHAMERYFTNTAFVDFGDRMAEGVMKSMMKYMKLIKEDPENYDYRAEIMWGCKAAQDDFIGVGREQCWESHLLQRDIGSICMDSSHGAGLAVVVPHWMRHVYKVNVPRFSLNGQTASWMSRSIRLTWKQLHWKALTAWLHLSRALACRPHCVSSAYPARMISKLWPTRHTRLVRKHLAVSRT